MKSSTVWWKVSLLLCVIILCCFRHGDTACDKFTQCHLIYPDDNIRCSVDERGNCNSADSCYGIDSMLHSCHCNGEGLTLNLTECNGRDSFTCTRRATWDEEFSKLSCTVRSCSRPIFSDKHVRVSPDQESYVNGSEVNFKCSHGFDLSTGKNRTICLYGSWEHYTEPKCRTKPCDAPILWDNSLVLIPNQTSYANMTEVTFRCVEGFELSGDTPSVVCNYGNWSSYQYPNCTVRRCSRPIFSDKHVRVSPDQESYANGSKVYFECLGCFNLNAQEISTVCLYGIWESYTEPTCTRKVCLKPNLEDKRVIVSTERYSYSNGTKVNFSCRLLYTVGEITEAVCWCGDWGMPQGEPSCHLDLLTLSLVTCGFLTAGIFAVVCLKHNYHRTGSMLIKTEPTLEVPSDNQQTYISKLNFEMSDPKDEYKNDYSSASPNDNNETTADVTNDEYFAIDCMTFIDASRR